MFLILVNYTSLAAEYKVSRPTIYRILKAARLKLPVPQKSTNNRFKQARYGMKRLAKVEREIEERLKKQARRYNKSYPGEMAHFDTKRLPRLKNQTVADPFEYLFVAIDGYSREPYAAILSDRTAAGAAKFLLRDVIDCCPYTVECAYSDNGVECKGNASYPFGAACRQNNIVQKFTCIARPQTNGKAERVIRTLTEMWHKKQTFTDAQQRRRDLRRFANFYS